MFPLTQKMSGTATDFHIHNVVCDVISTNNLISSSLQ